MATSAGGCTIEILVISDSAVRVRPDYLRTMVAQLAEPQVGCICTLFKVIEAHRWFERLELLTMNGDFIPNVIFAQVTGASNAAWDHPLPCGARPFKT